MRKPRTTRSAASVIAVSLIACVIIATFLIPHSALASDFSKTKWIDYNEPMRIIDREVERRALAKVDGDKDFEKLCERAQYIPHRDRVYGHGVALGGPFATPAMYARAERELSALESRPPEAEPRYLPRLMSKEFRVNLAKKYIWYKVSLQDAKGRGQLPETLSGKARGAFHLSATETALGSAKRDLADLVGQDVANQLELELYPKLPSGWSDDTKPVDAKGSHPSVEEFAQPMR